MAAATDPELGWVARALLWQVQTAVAAAGLWLLAAALARSVAAVPTVPLPLVAALVGPFLFFRQVDRHVEAKG